MTRRATLTCIAAILSPRAACLRAQTATVRDSAGIEIVENHGPRWGPDEAWSVSEEPFLRIGSIDDPESALYGVRWAGRLPNGDILVMSPGDHQVIVFDSQGHRVRTFGRKGEGPGEFSSGGPVVRLDGDTILVSDQYKAKIFTTGGEFVREFRVLGTPLPMVLRGRLAGSVLHVAQDEGVRDIHLDGEGHLSAEYHEGSSIGAEAWIAVGLDGTIHDTVAVTRGREQYYIRDGDGGIVLQPAWGRAQYGTVGASHIITGWNDTFELRFIGLDGTLDRIVRLDRQPKHSSRAEMMRRSAPTTSWPSPRMTSVSSTSSSTESTRAETVPPCRSARW